MNPIISMLAYTLSENRVAIAIELKPQWHIYWENPGDTGMETSLAAGQLIFPTPTLFLLSGGLRSYGYEGAFVLFAEGIQAESLTIRWLACKEDICIPGHKTLSRQKERKDWREWETYLPQPFLGRVEHQGDHSVVHLQKGILFPSLETEPYIHSVDYQNDSIVISWKTKPEHGRMVLGLHGSKKGYEIIW